MQWQICLYTVRPVVRAELLTQASRQIMIEMVSVVFKGLSDIPDVPMTPTTARSLAELAHSPRLHVSPDAADQGPLLSPFLGGGGGTVASTAGALSHGAVTWHRLVIPCALCSEAALPSHHCLPLIFTSLKQVEVHKQHAAAMHQPQDYWQP